MDLGFSFVVHGASGITGSVSSMSITETLGHHAVVAARTVMSDQTDLSTGTPVTVSWGGRSIAAYVSHVRRSPDPLSGEVVVYCVGATWPLKSGQHRTWDGYKLSSVVKDVVSPYRLAATVDDLDYPITASQSNGKSDWEFLSQLAVDHGRILVANNTTVHFIDPSKAVRSATNNGKLTPVSMISITADAGATSPRGGDTSQRVVFGLDESGHLLSGSSAPPPPGSRLSVVSSASPFTKPLAASVGSLAAAAQKVGAETNVNRWGVTAKGSAIGNAYVTCGSLVLLSNTRKVSLGHGVEGVWAVTKVEHVVAPKRYSMEVELGRDGFGAAFPRTPLNRQTVTEDGRVKTTPPPRILQGRWVSAWE